MIFCTLLIVLCTLVLQRNGQNNNSIIKFFSFELNISTIQGVISAIRMLLFILLVFIQYEYGSKISLILVSFSMIHNIYNIVSTRTLYALPGLLTSIVTILTIVIIYYFYRRSTLRSYTDLITGLKNRRAFIEEVTTRIQSKNSFKLACIEIEDFKHINDIYGIQTGDFVLQKTANKFNSVITKKDSLFKITGAIFVVLFDGDADCESVLKKLITPESVIIPKNDDEKNSFDRTCVINFAAGVAQYPQDSTNSTILLKHADIALSNAKKQDDLKLSFFDEALEAKEAKQKEAEFLINEALENDYFYLVFQPQFTLNEKNLRGFEALIRCKKPDGQIISPNVFIPAAEKSNLILRIDDWVLHHAMTKFKPVVEKNGNNFTISVNVSAKNVSQNDFPERLSKIIETTQFPANCLEIEITEYSFAEKMENTITNIKKLRELGVQVALDDFGTGYTSIAQLMKLPINLLKIDKTLIDNIESDRVIQDLIDSVIYMGHIMNCEVISEGVESEQQLSVLKEHKCDFVQGFVWGKPLDFEDAVTLLK